MAEAAALAGAGWVVSPIVTRLLNEGFDYLGDNGCSCLAAGIKDRLDNLETTILPQFQLVIEAAEKTEHKNKMERWLRKLKDALYEAEDMLDLYKYQLLEEKVSVLNTRPALKPFNKVAKKVNDKLSIFPRQKIKLRRSLNKLAVIAAEAKTFRELLQIPIGDDGTVAQTFRNIEQPDVTTSVPLHQVFGREKELDELIKYLLDPSEAFEPEKRYSVGTIVGIGGAGKTTLAQLVYNDPNVVNHFDIMMWVCVSRKLDLVRHTKDMIESSGKSERPNLESLGAIQRKLTDLVKLNKVLLVLDDVWCDDKWANEIEWQTLLAPLAKSVKRGSKVLVTTRAEKLTVALRPQYRMALEDLEENDMLSLFKLHAFCGTKVDDSDLQEELMTIGKQIVRKLHGSPLAAKAVGCQLSKTWRVDAWKAAVKQDNLHYALKQALLWSYQRLDAPLQRCFSYLSLFSKGTRFEAEQLVYLWIAEGFINSSKDDRRMEDIAMGYFNELVSGSFLQHDKDDAKYYMHNLFHVLAENISKGDCLRIEDNDQVKEIPPTIRHLSISGGHTRESNIGFKKLENLHSLIIDGSLSPPAIANLFAAIEKSKKLRVLLLFGMRREKLAELLAKAKHLKHLRFLRFDWSGRVELPAALGKLYRLEVLSLNSDDASLPRILRNLINLRHFIGNDEALASLPDIGRLTYLQTLPKFIVKKEKGHDIGQLKNLNELRKLLTISNLENVEGKDKAIEANLKDKRHLEHLLLRWGKGDDAESDCRRDLDMEVLQGLQPHPNLTKLTIEGYNSPRCPSWLLREGCLQNLRYLKFDNCAALEVLPPISNLFPNCSKLKISELSKLRKFPSLPQSLTKLVIGYCPSLIIISEDEVQMSDDDQKKSIMTTMQSYQLTNRELNGEEIAKDCLEVKRLLESEKVDVPEDFMTLVTTLQSYERVDDLDLQEAYYRCQELRLEAIFGRREKSELILPSSLQTLILDHCNITDGALSQSLQGLTSLESLELIGINTITILPSDGVLHHLTALKHLSIHSCPTIFSLPEHLPQSLRKLDLSYRTYISLPEHLPESLAELYLNGCSSISSLPEHLPKSLSQLHLSNCHDISLFSNHLPESLSQLHLSNCHGVSSLPEHLTESLSQLHLSNCHGISSLPEHLPESLSQLHLSNCPGISSLSEHLPESLSQLHLSYCPGISSLPEHLPESLSQLHLSYCPGISSLPEHLPESLSQLHLYYCPGISSLPEHMLESLSQLHIQDCHGILSLPEHLPESLSYLYLKGCPNISSLPEHLPESLRGLFLKDCPYISSLPEHLPEWLITISIEGCQILEERCRGPNGEDWQKIAHIPDRKI